MAPSEENGLRLACQIQVEKIATVRRNDIGKHIGRLEDEAMRRLEAALVGILGLD